MTNVMHQCKKCRSTVFTQTVQNNITFIECLECGSMEPPREVLVGVSDKPISTGIRRESPKRRKATIEDWLKYLRKDWLYGFNAAAGKMSETTMEYFNERESSDGELGTIFGRQNNRKRRNY